MEVSTHRPMGRASSACKSQNVTRRRHQTRKDVKNEDRSHDVYENKGSHDKMSGEKADIFGNRHLIAGQKRLCGVKFALN
jgi:hypothetical protein